VLALMNGCAPRDRAAEMREARAAAQARLRACLPETQPEGHLRLAVAEVRRQPEETSVRLVAYAIGEPADFDLPVYLMSRGRWLINEQGRAYLLDEQCREYKLKDRRPAAGQVAATPSGRVPLKPGEVFEVTLSFPRLPDQTREGALVYGAWVFPFSLLMEAR
jgi:hypothetical protein